MSNEQRENVSGRISILAIETTGPYASVALATGGYDGQFVMGELRSDGKLTHLTSLTPMIKVLLDEEGLALADVSALAVSAGPGSFTGIRIGVSTARALAQALGIGIIKVPTLETFVYQCGAQAIVCPVFDARRSQIYAGAYMRNEDEVIETLVKGDAWDPEEFMDALGQSMDKGKAGGKITFDHGITFCGDGAHLIEGLIESPVGNAGVHFTIAESPEMVQSAASALKWALYHGKFSRYWEVEPIYMRKAEAQRKLEEKQALEGVAGDRPDGETGSLSR